MSGIFKYTPNRTAASTPNRRSAFGVTGFGGSPVQQQDATMDNSYSMGFRSPSMSALAGQTSPAQGRSLREYEEQMSALRKENFNLKLRIYFLEENAGMGGAGSTSGGGPGVGHASPDGAAPENLFKQNIDLKVEVESLRKDLQDKQDLLCQAAKAMELMEDSQRKAEEHHREVLGDMEHRLETLQHEIKQMEAAERLQQHNHVNRTQRLNETGLLDFLDKMEHRDLSVQDKLQSMEMETVVRQCHEQNEELCRRIGDLHTQLEEKERKIGAMEAEINELRFECAEMKDKLEENDKSTSDGEQMIKLLQNSMNAKEERVMHLSLENKVLKSLNDHLNERNYRLKEDSCKQLRIITDQTRLVQEMSDIIAAKKSLQHGYNEHASKFKRERNKLLSEIEQLKIIRLKKDLFEVKSELADKLCQLDEAESKAKEKTTDLMKTVTVVQKLLKSNTELEKEISKLKRNSIVSDPGNISNPSPQQTILDQDQLPVSQDEYDALCQRLKLLQKKNDSLIQKLTGNSNDRSNENIIIKQLNEELMQAREEAEKAQRWRKECVDLCAISTARLEELAGFLDSLLRSKEFCGSLSMDRRKAIRKAVDRSLDLSRSLNMSISVTGFSLPENSLANLSCLSGFLDAGEDSILAGEANKENRTFISHEETGGSAAKVIEVLKAENRELRGQLEGRGGSKKGHSDARRKLIPLLTEPLSDSEAWSEPDRDVSLARIGLEERSSLTNSGGKGKPPGRGLGGVLQEVSSTSENEGILGHSRKQVLEVKQLHDTVGTLTNVLQEKDSKILDIQSKLVDLDNKLQEERMKASRTQVELENTRHVNQRLEKENDIQQDRVNSSEKRLEELSREIQQKDDFIEKLKKDREQAFVDLRVAVMKLDTLRSEHQEVQQKHKVQIESLLAQERQRLEDLRHDLTESFNSQLKAKQASFDASLNESYISKNIYMEKVKELEELHFRVEDAHLNLVSMSEEETKLKLKLAEAEKSVILMRKTLDETTLQASKAALERTKALNEKRLIEDELKHVQFDLEAVKAEKNDLNTKLAEAQSQLQLCQRSPPKRLNSSSGAEGSTASGYTSEELLLGGSRTVKAEGRSRMENSSPDLGIESDAGRLSNTENHPKGPTTADSPARPLLKTLELTKSMSNLLMEPKEEANHELNTSATDGSSNRIHDCAKIETDYAELKRRYKQTRRHLELAYDSIKSSNKRKEQLERDIKQQIQKTNVVLKTVRTNMTNELEKSGSNSAISPAAEVRKS